jgi:hypothetical protein
MAAKRLFRYPYATTAQMLTTGGGQTLNGGALVAGETRDFPQDAFLNALDRPFIVTRLKFAVTRVAGGAEVDSDYDNVQINLRDLVRNEDVTKDPVALSVLLDRQRREWLFHPGSLILRRLGGGLKIRASVNAGAIGAPYNLSVAVHGYTEMYAEPSEGMYPEER